VSSCLPWPRVGWGWGDGDRDRTAPGEVAGRAVGGAGPREACYRKKRKKTASSRVAGRGDAA